MNKRSVLIMLAGITLFAACSSPKYTYNFGYYKNNNAKLKEQPVVAPAQTEVVSSPAIAPVVSLEAPVYANGSTKTVATTEGENANRITERMQSLQTKAERVENDLSLTKAEHKAAKKEVKQELKSFIKDVKKNPLNDESAKAGDKSQLVALLLAIFLGGIGIHDFYLGHIGRGIIKIVLAILGFLIIPLIALYIWVLIDIILIAVGSQKPKGGEYAKTL